MATSSTEEDTHLWATRPSLRRLWTLEHRLDTLSEEYDPSGASLDFVRAHASDIAQCLLVEERATAAAERQLDEQRGRAYTPDPGPAPLSTLEGQAAKRRGARVTHATFAQEQAFLAPLSRDDQRLYHLLTDYPPQERREAPPSREVETLRIVPLYDYPASWAGCLFPCPSGVAFEQQVCGLRCLHERMEGVLIPLPQTGVGAALFALDAGCCGDLSPLEGLLIDLELCAHQVPLAVDLARLSASTEAWVWVRVDERASDFSLFAFRGQSGVLTYENCD